MTYIGYVSAHQNHCLAVPDIPTLPIGILFSPQMPSIAVLWFPVLLLYILPSLETNPATQVTQSQEEKHTVNPGGGGEGAAFFGTKEPP